MIIGGHVSLAKLGLVPFTPSKHHAVACLDTIFFDKSKKTIVRSSEKRLKIGTQPDVITMTEKTVVENTNQDPKFLASVSIAATQVNANNVDKLMEDAEHYKEKTIKMKDTLINERGEGKELKRKHEAILSKKKSLQKVYQDLEIGSDALVVKMPLWKERKRILKTKLQNWNYKNPQQYVKWKN